MELGSMLVVEDVMGDAGDGIGTDGSTDGGSTGDELVDSPPEGIVVLGSTEEDSMVVTEGSIGGITEEAVVLVTDGSPGVVVEGSIGGELVELLLDGSTDEDVDVLVVEGLVGSVAEGIPVLGSTDDGDPVAVTEASTGGVTEELETDESTCVVVEGSTGGEVLELLGESVDVV